MSPRRGWLCLRTTRRRRHKCFAYHDGARFSEPGIGFAWLLLACDILGQMGQSCLHVCRVYAMSTTIQCVFST